ncbi:MAG: hypothetical protein KDD61_16210 [Bdellovibrionales bacterium]|nr:hypothetical protein [Bdellovibrionales bacterium]
MKFIVVVLSLFFISTAYGYTYNCRGTDWTHWQIQIETNETGQFVYRNFNEWNYSYGEPILYHLNGYKKNGRFQGQYVLELDLSTVGHDYYQIPSLIVQPCLFTGGCSLQNGQLGGYVNYLEKNHKYSAFLCIRTK